MRRLTLLDAVLREVILYGGLPLTRHDVYTLALTDTGSPRGADFFAFCPPAIVADPVSIATFRQYYDDETEF